MQVLIIDNDIAYRNGVSMAASNKHWIPVLCGDIRTAKQIISSTLPDLIISDCLLYGETVIDLLVWILFTAYGYTLHIRDELVVDTFASLPEQEQGILILHCVLELADGEIGSLVGMSRSAVQRHRTKALNELRKRLEDERRNPK